MTSVTQALRVNSGQVKQQVTVGISVTQRPYRDLMFSSDTDTYEIEQRCPWVSWFFSSIADEIE